MRGRRRRHGHDDARNARVPVARADPARAGDARSRTSTRWGSSLFEMLTGEHPVPRDLAHGAARPAPARRAPIGSRRSTRPACATVDGVIARATAKDAGERFPDVARVAAAFRAALEGTASPASPGQIRNPYKGLRAFLEADAGDFFGREAVTQAAHPRLAEDEPAARFLAVVGPSGSGKSSVVRAGLVPALRRGAIPGSERWYVVEMLPGLASVPRARDRAARRRRRAAALADGGARARRARPRCARPTRPPRSRRRARCIVAGSARRGLHDGRRRRGARARSSRAFARRRSSRTAGSASSRPCARTSTTPAVGAAASATCSAARTEAITPMSPGGARARDRRTCRSGRAASVEPRLLAEMIADVADRRARSRCCSTRSPSSPSARTANAHPRGLPAHRRCLGRARAAGRAAVRGR